MKVGCCIKSAKTRLSMLEPLSTRELGYRSSPSQYSYYSDTYYILLDDMPQRRIVECRIITKIVVLLLMVPVRTML